jgi:hypothetical protein
MMLPGTPEQKFGVLNALKIAIEDTYFKQLIDFHIPQVKKFGDAADVSNITIKFDLEFTSGGVQNRVGNYYYFGKTWLFRRQDDRGARCKTSSRYALIPW